MRQKKLNSSNNSDDSLEREPNNKGFWSREEKKKYF